MGTDDPVKGGRAPGATAVAHVPMLTM